MLCDSRHRPRAVRTLAVIGLFLIARTEGWGPKPNQTYIETVPKLASTSTARPATGIDVDDNYVFPDTDGDCPRDEDAVKFQGQVCMKRCDSDNDCRSRNRKCVCDGACGMSCVKQDKECPKLKPPDYGRMRLNGRLYASTARYACREGYRLVGPTTRTCQADGQWSAHDPICKLVNKDLFCVGSPNITNARHNASYDLSTFDLNTTLYYSCYPGYQSRGMFSEAKCLMYNDTAKWFGPDMHCDPKHCPPPRSIEHGQLESNCSAYLCRASYQCDQGFELVGRANTYCQSDGTWQPSELPTCTPVQCSPPRTPLYGRVEVKTTTVSSIVHYSCQPGYVLVGSVARTCQPDKRWSGDEPVCQVLTEIKCPMPGPLHNGWIGGNSTLVNSQITFHCNKDTVRVGQSESATCSSNGGWSHPLPKCMGPCTLPRVPQGEIINATSDLIMHGENITVKCRDRYEMQLSHQMPVCYNGTWTHVPICVPARCKELPPDPEHGFVIAPKNDHGSRAKFVCRDGYVIEGDNITTCTYGEWTGTVPRCKIVYCSFPGNLTDGRILLVGNMGLYDYREYVKKVRNDRMISFKCKKGYTLSSGPSGATCVDGHWRPPGFPTCTLDRHPTLSSWFNKRSVRSARWSLVRRLRRWAAAPDQPRSASAGRRRLAGGRKRRRRRRRQPCEPIPNESYIRVEVVRPGKDANNTFSRGSRVKVICGHGYELNIGNRLARCVRGRWKPEKPNCVAMSCSLPEVKNGVWMQRGEPVPTSEQVSHETVVDLSCEEGYTVQGATAVTCWYGFLTNQVPECAPAPCQLPTLSNGSYTEPGYKSGLFVAHNFGVAYQCDPGFLAASEPPVLCQSGRFTPAPPQCQMGLLNTVNDYAGEPLQLTEVLPEGTLAQRSEYAVGGDITAGDLSGLRKPCGPPAQIQNSVIYTDGQLANGTEKQFPDGSEVTFDCVTGVGGEKTSWRIMCEDGSWVGRSLSCDENDLQDPMYMRNKSCTFYNDMINVMTFFQDQPVLEKKVEFPPGTKLTFRCDDIGKFAMIGSNQRTCVRGDWDGARPICFGLNQMNDYALEKPPTILFRHKSGPIAQSNDGKLIVYPGAVLHLECLWIRKFGSPTWEVSHQHRTYPHGWTTEEGRDSNLEYRLSIYHAQAEDSGSYTCVTPPRHRHGVHIEVKAVRCPIVPERPGLYKSTHDTKMNTQVEFSCANGNTLIGAHQMTCLPSGNWSAPMPHCETIGEHWRPGLAADRLECPEFRNIPDPNVKVAILNRQVTGKAIFECPRGYQKVGAHEAYCQVNGQWSQQPPTCEELLCQTPEVPENGMMTPQDAPHMVGDVIQFSCKHGYMMEGQPIVECLETREWSREIPQCVRACTYPGSTIGGTISKVKFYYSINEVVVFTCDNGLELVGEHTLECLPGGVWSSRIPSCVGRTL
ncbi:sushi, von Willebrand factor type A, EGF and pentraxin domain-containing protein 1-like isoform X2 [Amphibalanus amphitrite]|uniref:sushi, von Willebrand factor type A, EGF and pentraxin domain-containing protein 1-like isoform X2 n=1 Tax=Amphibalanus amphitrite TaxID=1232801 RepID=UPI001C91F856|nr:sushi, von Willebrand factor type A, EGF and pentraxin domain-containing protein 1-like isoform X2 [Amphibalanus amphitrite]